MDALRARRAHAAQRTAQIPPTGRSGSPRPVSAIEPLSHKPVDRRGTGSGTTGDQGSPAFFQCTLLAARRAVPPPRQRSGSAGTLPGLGARSWKPCAPPLGDRTSRGRSSLRTPRCTRTHNARARCPLRSARWRFHTERGSIFPFPLLGKGRLGRRAASGWQLAQEQVLIRLGSSRTSGEARGVAGRRGGRGSVAGG